MSFTLREMSSRDGAALGELIDASPDSGAIQVSPRIFIDTVAYLTAEPGTVGVVATHPDHDGLVGAGLVTLLDVRLAGGIHRAAYLSSLVVHPSVRRQGLATQIAHWRIDHAQATAGKDVIVFANIQDGNTGSTANARKWATHMTGAVDVVPARTLNRPPKLRTSAIVRAATADDYPAFAQGANAYYASMNLHPPLSVANMAEWAANSPVDTPVNTWWVAEQNGQMVAGMGLHDTTALSEIRITSVPPPIRLVNLFLRVIPAEGVMRENVSVQLWHAPGHDAVARDLFACMRHHCNDRANVLRIHVDRRTSLAKAPGVPPWYPKSAMMTAIRAPFDLDQLRPTYAYLRV